MKLKMLPLFVFLLALGGCCGPEDDDEFDNQAPAPAATAMPKQQEQQVPQEEKQHYGQKHYAADMKTGTKDEFIEVIGDRVYFGFDKFSLDSKSQETLKRQAAWLKKNPHATVTITGHCDVRGTREYNIALGARRANSAKDFLISQGVAPHVITKVISYGKDKIFDDGSTEAAHAKNRVAVVWLN